MKTPYPIVFCENSGYKSEEIEGLIGSVVNNKSEYLQFDGQQFPRELGKGYGELTAIKYAVEHSNIIRHSDYVIKVNGRYFIKNIKKITRALLTDRDVYIVADLQRNLTWGDTRVFIFKPSFITDYLSELLDSINDLKGSFLEHALARAVFRAIGDGYKWKPLPSNPIIIGYSGTYDIPYNPSVFRQIADEISHRVKNYLNKKD